MGEAILFGRLLDGEGVASALEVIMGQNGAADNRQIGIRADEIMREGFNKAKQTLQRILRQLHRHMIMVEHDTMLVIVHIRRVLEEPFLIVHRKRNHSQILARRVIDPSGIADILAAELAFRIDRRREQPGHGDFLRAFLRFGEIDRHLDIPVRRILEPIHILGHPVHTDIVGINTQLIKAVSGRLNALPRLDRGELRIYLRRPGHQKAHDLGVQQIAVSVRILRNQPGLKPVVDQLIQRCLRTLKRTFSEFTGIRLTEAELVQQFIAAVINVSRLNQLLVLREQDQLLNRIQCLLRGCSRNIIVLHFNSPYLLQPV